MQRTFLLISMLALALAAAATWAQQEPRPAASGMASAGPVIRGTPDDPHRDPREVHLRNVRQLTFGGTNAEAYFSPDGQWLIFQSTRDAYPCDQMFVMKADGSDVRLVSTGKGKTTCGYFFQDGKRILFSSTHESGAECPPRPDYSKGYVWGVYSSFQLFTAMADGSGLKRLTSGPGYNAEATLSRDGKKIVFTSSRDGDLDIYVMHSDGSGVQRLTHELGYDGGPFFSHDGQWIVYRAHHPTEPAEVARYRELLAQELVEPMKMDLYVMRADGSQQHQITRLGGASFAPFFFPDDQRIIFASNYENPGSSRFELYSIPRQGGQPERVTFTEGFNSFPMFSPDGKKLVFASNRNAPKPREINIFVADWVP
jgi:TolB protein